MIFERVITRVGTVLMMMKGKEGGQTIVKNFYDHHVHEMNVFPDRTPVVKSGFLRRFKSKLILVFIYNHQEILAVA